uniref:Uncharacterized protein n=1 Tax=Arundo donax TaxID=35708 RepID=A0A0A9BZU7_ARUDO
MPCMVTWDMLRKLSSLFPEKVQVHSIAPYSCVVCSS